MFQSGNNNKPLAKARAAKKNEFYTRMVDIEKEIPHYTEHLKGKTIYCNCDDPDKSNFTKYFLQHFSNLGLKRLISTCYIEGGHGKILDTNSNVYESELQGDGDFRSDECIELLKQADVVITNPPFSLFNSYLETLVKYNKSFLVIGNQIVFSHKVVVPLLVDNKLWTGYGFKNGTGFFENNYDRVESQHQYDDGLTRISFIRWMTNLDIPRHHEFYQLKKHYTPEEYPKFDNCDIININRYPDIPKDYAGVMGVPITFVSQFCPEQFECFGTSRYHLGAHGEREHLSKADEIHFINGKELYNRLLIRNKHPEIH